MNSVQLIFTFQSGSILIYNNFATRNGWDDLYIPIWFYSNVVFIVKPKCNAPFTFQSGSILMSI